MKNSKEDLIKITNKSQIIEVNDKLNKIIDTNQKNHLSSNNLTKLDHLKDMKYNESNSHLQNKDKKQ